jgi:fatty acid/phospholipid biosynthesis enzyme
MVTVIGVDGIGGDLEGDAGKQLPPHLRAILATFSAKPKDAKYAIALPESVNCSQASDNVELVPICLSDKQRRDIKSKTDAWALENREKDPARHRALLEKNAMQENAIAYFAEKKLPLVTAFNSQVGIPAILRSRIPGIKRVALAPELPRDRHDTPFLFLDLGANSEMHIARDIDTPPEVPLDELVDKEPAEVKKFLAQQRAYSWKLANIYLPSKQYEKNAKDIAHFACLGALYMELRHQRQKPRVGLLNIGTEDGKGNIFLQKCDEAIKEAAQAGHFEYIGFAEPADIPRLDVLVTDGFSGNLALKFTEQTLTYAKDKIPSIVRGVFKLIGKGGSTAKWEAAYIAGLPGTVLKLHGAASTEAYAAAYARIAELTDRVCVGTGTSAAIYPSLSSAMEQEYVTRYYPEGKKVSNDIQRFIVDTTRKLIKPK